LDRVTGHLCGASYEIGNAAERDCGNTEFEEGPKSRKKFGMIVTVVLCLRTEYPESANERPDAEGKGNKYKPGRETVKDEIHERIVCFI
jgi:hypothetical protein